MNGKHRPHYSVSVRLGLQTIARRTKPFDKFEMAALKYIDDMKRWHAEISEARKQKGKA